MQLELEKNLDSNKNLIVEKQNNFFNTTFGIAVNEALNFGLKKLLPDFLEEQVIDIKDAILNSGLKEGINTAIDSVMELGKSIAGIFTGDFKKVSEIELAVQKGGLLSEFSDLLDKSLDKIKESEYIDNDVFKIIKGGTNVIEDSLKTNISDMLKEQKQLLNSVENYIEKWQEYKTEKDFEKMEKEYQKIQEKIELVVPLEETMIKLQELENLHNLIKNNGRSFELSTEQIELAKKL